MVLDKNDFRWDENTWNGVGVLLVERSPLIGARMLEEIRFEINERNRIPILSIIMPIPAQNRF